MVACALSRSWPVPTSAAIGICVGFASGIRFVFGRAANLDVRQILVYISARAHQKFL